MSSVTPFLEKRETYRHGEAARPNTPTASPPSRHTARQA